MHDRSKKRVSYVYVYKIFKLCITLMAQFKPPTLSIPYRLHKSAFPVKYQNIPSRSTGAATVRLSIRQRWSSVSASGTIAAVSWPVRRRRNDGRRRRRVEAAPGRVPGRPLLAVGEEVRWPGPRPTQLHGRRSCVATGALPGSPRTVCPPASSSSSSAAGAPTT